MMEKDQSVSLTVKLDTKMQVDNNKPTDVVHHDDVSITCGFYGY